MLCPGCWGFRASARTSHRPNPDNLTPSIRLPTSGERDDTETAYSNRLGRGAHFGGDTRIARRLRGRDLGLSYARGDKPCENGDTTRTTASQAKDEAIFDAEEHPDFVSRGARIGLRRSDTGRYHGAESQA